uniref:Zinc finger protein 79-like n=1 Tax=Phallusia mammillata TaxID=59560 RepID=A0A6F9DYF7_9ASCI|nr:zinc finger protein 79-like [Phallusia mammillata]
MEQQEKPTVIDIFEFPSFVLTQLNVQRLNLQFCDATIVTKDGKMFHAHKAVLAASSTYFKTSFSLDENKNRGHNIQGDNVVLQLNMISSTVFECLLNVIYTSKLKLTDLDINDIETAADWLKLHQVGAVCRQYQTIQSPSTSQGPIKQHDSGFPDVNDIIAEDQSCVDIGSKAPCKSWCTRWFNGSKIPTTIENSPSPDYNDSEVKMPIVEKYWHESFKKCSPSQQQTEKTRPSSSNSIASPKRDHSPVNSSHIPSSERNSVKHLVLQKAFSSPANYFKHPSPFCYFPHSLMIPIASPVFLHKNTCRPQISSHEGSSGCPPDVEKSPLFQNSSRFINGLPMPTGWPLQSDNTPLSKTNNSNVSCGLKTWNSFEKLVNISSSKQDSHAANSENQSNHHEDNNDREAPTGKQQGQLPTTVKQQTKSMDKDITELPIESENNKAATSRKTYQCKFCNSAFPSRAGLSVHLRSHTGERPYHCNVCGKAFTQLGHVQRHQKVHTGEKPFQCSWCHARVRDKASMHYHILAHKGIKPFQCDQCEAKFTKRSSLVKHKNVHTGDFLYQCSQCQASFREKASLSRHRRCQHSTGQNLAEDRAETNI